MLFMENNVLGIKDYSTLKKTPNNRTNQDIIDRLLNIRLSLKIKKLVSPTISRNDLKKMVDDEVKGTNKEVKDAINNVFEEYFPKEHLTSTINESLVNEKIGGELESRISLTDMGSQANNDYSDNAGSNQKGRAYVKNGYFNSTNSTSNQNSNAA